MNTNDLNKLLEEYGKKTKQEIDLIKPMNEQTNFTEQLSEKEKDKFYKKQKGIAKKEIAKQQISPEEEQ